MHACWLIYQRLVSIEASYLTACMQPFSIRLRSKFLIYSTLGYFASERNVATQRQLKLKLILCTGPEPIAFFKTEEKLHNNFMPSVYLYDDMHRRWTKLPSYLIHIQWPSFPILVNAFLQSREKPSILANPVQGKVFIVLYIILAYRKVWLISACAYHSRWWGNMRLLDDVRLIESEIFAPPIVSTFGEYSIDRAHNQQVMNSAILEKF